MTRVQFISHLTVFSPSASSCAAVTVSYHNQAMICKYGHKRKLQFLLLLFLTAQELTSTTGTVWAWVVVGGL